MRNKTIDQYMWAWQHSYDGAISSAAQALFAHIGITEKPKIFVVGIAWPGKAVRHDACVQPEDGEWPQALFSQIRPQLEDSFLNHSMQDMFYGDAPAMRDKPENIRRLVVSQAVMDALSAYDNGNQVRSFVSAARPIGDYHVVVVLQAPIEVIETYPVVAYRYQGKDARDNFLFASINVLFDEAQQLLERPEPGRFLRNGMRSAAEMAIVAADRFFRTPFINEDLPYTDLFREFNGLSKLMYEGARGRGRLALIEADDPRLDYVVKLDEPAPLSEARWARKLLEMSGDGTVIASGYRKIHGLARIKGDQSEICFVDFLDQQHWEFRRGDDALVRVAFGEPRLPRPPISTERFRDNFTRLFPQATEADAGHCYAMLNALFGMDRGAMLIIADDAEAEANRLAAQGTKIEPVRLSEDLLGRASRIDGTIIADPTGMCHAIGVILDGSADEACTPSRGARYNSAVRYVNRAGEAQRLAFVISEDHTLDILPLLRPRISRSLLETNLENLESATIENWFAPRNFIRDHRFYLDSAQCQRANAAIERLAEEARMDGQLVLVYNPLQPEPSLTEDYFLP